MSVVNSYAQLISAINANSALANEYSAKARSASANSNVASAYQYEASSVYNHFVSASANYQNNLDSASAASTANSEVEKIARVYGLDAATTNSLVNQLSYGDSSETSNETHNIVDNMKVDNVFGAGNVESVSATSVSNGSLASYRASNGSVPPISAQSIASPESGTPTSLNNVYTLLSDTSEENQYNSLSAAYESKLNSYRANSASLYLML